MLPHLKYRADIDGLRAIAVLSVVFFHAFPRQLAGGYLGVDIFFVISGYLISSIIFKGLEHGTFSIADFYGRRIRRIFPALFLVLASCYLLGWFVLFEDEYKQLGRNIAGGTSFISNFILWSDSGYFDQSSELKPLLHLWSLAIEEQFYLIWPMLLWFAYTRKTNLLLITLVIAVGSFAFNVYEVRLDRVAAFYSPLTRFWELLAGAVLAYLNLQVSIKSGLRLSLHNSLIFQNVKSASGFLLLGLGLLVLDGDSAFPGWLALFPVIGATLIISAGPDAWLNRNVLASKLFVSIGLISYPLYLWHWPLLSYMRIVEGAELSFTIRLFIVALSITLAWMTYAFLEKPLRSVKYRQPLTLSLFSLMLGIGIVGFITMREEGIQSRRIAVISSEISSARLDHQSSEPLFTDGRIDETNNRFEGESSDVVLFVGDSLMGHYLPRLKELYKDPAKLPHYSSVFLARDGCRPVPFGEKINSAGKQCDEYYRAVIELAKSANVKKIVLSANWELVFSDESYSDNSSTFGADLFELNEMGKKVLFISMAPHSSRLNPMVLAKQLRLGAFLSNISLIKDQWIKRADFEVLNENFPRLVEFSTKVGASVINPLDYFCTQEECPIVLGGKPLYSDNFHITSGAVVQYATFIDPIVQPEN
ncbi:MAG: acyltransferase family protein [Pseudomonadota bacterium]